MIQRQSGKFFVFSSSGNLSFNKGNISFYKKVETELRLRIRGTAITIPVPLSSGLIRL